MKLSAIQQNILAHLDRWPEQLRFGSHYTPKWWLEGGQRVSAQSCDALLLRGLIQNTRHLGDEPGINCFSITEAGRAALKDATHAE